jgi:hypothetical protein
MFLRMLTFRSGVAIGALSTFRLLGGAIATAIYTSIVDNQFADRIPGQISQAITGTAFDPANIRSLIQAAVSNSAEAFAEIPGVTEQIITNSQSAVKIAYTQAYRVVYLTALGFAALALICALLASNTDPAKKTLEKAVQLENEKAIAQDMAKEKSQDSSEP